MLRLGRMLFDGLGEFDQARSLVRAWELVSTGLSSTLHSASLARLGISAKYRRSVPKARVSSFVNHMLFGKLLRPKIHGIHSKRRGTQRSPRLARFGCIWGA